MNHDEYAQCAGGSRKEADPRAQPTPPLLSLASFYPEHFGLRDKFLDRKSETLKISKLTRKNVRQLDFELSHQRFQLVECNVPFPQFESVKHGVGDAGFLGEVRGPAHELKAEAFVPGFCTRNLN